MGQAFWSVQTDFTFSQSWGIRPVLFLDAGQASRPEDLFKQEPLVGAGIGASLLRGLIRFDLSQPLTQGNKLRFDIVFTAAR
jgi:hemolysin activation/secretion protein